ncbi:KEOPS complex subunit Cgi121 [Methanothermococcus sp. SCGC AD-155-C09]|nr:KEOPS complex subunit Cgi121 [Methanothermococcus sp. SCGC AD-155-C09]
MIIVGLKNCNITEELFKLNLPFQILNGDLIATEKHILHAINQAKSKEPITKSFWMEILVRASAQRQISNAIEIIGAKVGKGRNICIVCPNEDVLNKILKYVGGEIDNLVLELNPKKIEGIKKIYDIKGPYEYNCKNTLNEEYKENLIKRVCEKISLIEIT